MSKVVVNIIGYQVNESIEIRNKIFKLLCFGESKNILPERVETYIINSIGSNGIGKMTSCVEVKTTADEKDFVVSKLNPLNENIIFQKVNFKI